ncbi:hypothetical protein C8J48_2858 [Desmospora activa DSM 45169]|uniref:Uncharacterized protein n=1 Tax=Desmospora activa DSM 45169 TaxID=1121389 RepID=A0A2T4Z3U5_9BACL|nr:hypothetical protein C8J48_2858 [Desmospora activa DSM 45169]
MKFHKTPSFEEEATRLSVYDWLTPDILVYILLISSLVLMVLYIRERGKNKSK